MMVANSLLRMRVALMGLMIISGGCAMQSAPPPEISADAMLPVYAPLAPIAPSSPGSLFSQTRSLSLFTDRRAGAVGDIITIILEEEHQSSKSSETTLERRSDTSVREPTILSNLFRGVAANAGLLTSLSSDSSFEGEGESDQSNSLSGTLSATISKVYPNGTMMVQGEKWLRLNQGAELVRIAGILRPEDVGPDNTVSSLRLANARIAYQGEGALDHVNRAGWLARFFLSPLWAF